MMKYVCQGTAGNTVGGILQPDVPPPLPSLVTLHCWLGGLGGCLSRGGGGTKDISEKKVTIRKLCWRTVSYMRKVLSRYYINIFAVLSTVYHSFANSETFYLYPSFILSTAYASPCATYLIEPEDVVFAITFPVVALIVHVW